MRLAAWSLLALFSLVLAPACSGKYTTISDDPDDQENRLFQCDDYLACDIDTPCDTGECLSIPGCGSAICVSASVVCDQACGSTSCLVLDSYPAQLSTCPDGTPIKGKGEGISFPQPGTGGGPSYAGSTAVGGGYLAGAPSYGGYPAGGGGYGTGGYATGGTGTTGVVNCQSYARCNVNVACAGAGFDCINVPGCQLGICAPAFPLCDSLCAGACAVLEGYPVQLACSTNTITGYEGFDDGFGGTSFGGAPYGYAGEGTNGGYSSGGESEGGYGGAP